jgi:putative selenate reductase
MAQNIVLGWLAGCRIIELKTVQVRDDLEIPRPCIDMQTVGYNVEWSQELKLEESLEEYVKAAMLIEILKASGLGGGDVVYDMSVGYDLEGIRSQRVQAFMRGMRQARPLVERLRAQIPAEHSRFRDLDFPTCISRSVTLSTFHGCPPHEIEKIAEFLLEQGLACVVKLNPLLLGREQLESLLQTHLGYSELRVPEEAYGRDTTWPQAVAFCTRLARRARELGGSFGVKFCNTLIVRNHRSFFPATQKEMYLSGPPLHVLAMHLVRRWRREFGDEIPISFAAGIDRHNFPAAVSLGLVPVTVCSDLLKPGGYARAWGYLDELQGRMREVGAGCIEDFILLARGRAEAALGRLGLGEEDRGRCLEALQKRSTSALPEGLRARWVSETALLNTEEYVEQATADPRYFQAAHSKPPRKVGSRLHLFDCLTCDKCIPVCPNDANFRLDLPAQERTVLLLRHQDGKWLAREGPPLRLRQKHQIANFADFCNQCGNCDVFCPEEGGPYATKPRFFGSLDSFRASSGRDGFYLEPGGVRARFAGREFRLQQEDGLFLYAGPGFEVRFSPQDPAGTISGRAEGEVDLTWFHIMDLLRGAVLRGANYVSCLEEEPC